MLTAKTGDEARGDAFESGADIYVEKPFSIVQLKRQISNIFATRERFYCRMSQSNILSADTVADSPFLNPIDTQFIATLNSHLQANVEDENFAIDATAQIMNMSRSTFYRKIKAATGMTPNEYLKNYRLDHSTNLLKSGVEGVGCGCNVGVQFIILFLQMLQDQIRQTSKTIQRGLPEK